jgi:hypothetical protein
MAVNFCAFQAISSHSVEKTKLKLKLNVSTGIILQGLQRPMNLGYKQTSLI